MKRKKLILMTLVLALTLSMMVPAMMAASETTITGEYKEADIDVVVMPTGSATINPYSMPVPVYDTQATPAKIAGKTLNTAGKIATQPLVMYNKTNVNLSVGATVSATNITPGLTLVTRTITPTVTDKQALVFLEAMQDTTLTATDYKLTADTAGQIGYLDGAKVVDAFNAWEASVYSPTNPTQVIADPAAANGTTKKAIAEMKKADASGNPQSGSFVLYRLGGSCVESPTTPWATTDKFDIKVAFSFTPTGE